LPIFLIGLNKTEATEAEERLCVASVMKVSENFLL